MRVGDPLNQKDRESLGRLLRRRARRGKSGANPHTELKSWAEYGRVTLTPGPDRSLTTRWTVIILALIFVFGLPIGFALMQPYDTHAPHSASETLRIAGAAFVNTLIFLAVFAIICVVGLALLSPFMWVYARMDGDRAKDRERLIARAERLNQKGMAAGNGQGVAGIAAAEDAADGHAG